MKYFRFLLTIVFISSTSILKAQVESNSRWEAGLFLSPELNGSFKTKMAGRNISSKGAFGFSAGLNFDFKAGSKVTLRTGVAYGNKTYEIDEDDMVFPDDIDPQAGFISTSRSETIYHFDEIQIPFAFQYALVENSLFISGGLEAAFELSEKSERTLYHKNTITTSSPDNDWTNAALTLSMGARLQLGMSSFIIIEPIYKFYIRKIPLYEKSYFTLGLKTSWNFGL